MFQQTQNLKIMNNILNLREIEVVIVYNISSIKVCIINHY